MPINNYIASSAIAKPGVCTSSTRPASPYQGQVIYETDTAKTLVWNGSGWVFLSTSTANPVGLEFIASTTFSANANPSINGCFSSTYDHYRIMVSVNTSITATDVRLRVRSGTNSTQSGTIYDRFGFTSGTSIATANISGQTSAIILTGWTGNDVSNAVIDFFNPNKTTYKNMMIQGWNAQNGGSYFFNHRLSSTTAMTGFELVPDAGTVSGSMQVYGYRNS